jgi:hypothetical protein
MYNAFTWLPLESEIFILGFNVLFVFSLLYFCNYRVKIGEFHILKIIFNVFKRKVVGAYSVLVSA